MSIEPFVTLAKYGSKRKQVSLVEWQGQKRILKIYATADAARKDAALMRRLAMTGYAPEVREAADSYVVCEFIDGQVLSEAYALAIAADDREQLVFLANRLSIFLQMFHSVADGLIFGDTDFDNFIVRDDRCIGVSFDGADTGMPYTDVAGVAAYALTHTGGEFWCALPFVNELLSCFHMGVMDVINELSERLEKCGLGSYKTTVLDALLHFSDRDGAWDLFDKRK